MNKKGFTLIELLAVIVILAVIALIATPVIMNAISNAKQGAWKDAAYGIIKATENVYAKGFSETTVPVESFFLYENGIMTSYPSGKAIDYKGSVPLDGGIILHLDGSITLAIHDGVNCAVKTRSAGTVTVTVTDKATCISNIYYKQASEPFTNIVNNSDFSSGTTGWGGSFGSVSASNNTLTVTSNGGSYYSQASQTKSTTINVGDKFYCSSELRVLSPAVALFLQVSITGNVGTTINNPIAEKWYFNSVDLTSSVSSTYISIKPTQSYVDAATSNGKMLQIKNVSCFNLTNSFGAGNEPTKEQMDENLNKVWIDSTDTPKRYAVGGWVNF